MMALPILEWMKWDNARKVCTWTQKIACMHISQAQSNSNEEVQLLLWVRHWLVASLCLLGSYSCSQNKVKTVWLCSGWLREGSGGRCCAEQVGLWAPPTLTSTRAPQLLCLRPRILCKISFKEVVFKLIFYNLASTAPRIFPLMPVSPVVKQYLLLGYLLQPDEKQYWDNS